MAKLAIIPKGIEIPLPKGPLLSAKQIAEEFFGWVEGVKNPEARSPKWVLLRAPYKVTLGHSTVRFYRSDIEAWIASQRQESAA